MQEKRRNSRNTALLIDLLHIAVGILVLICAVLIFFNPEQNRILFPVIFGLAAFLHAVNGWFELHADSRNKHGKGRGLVQCMAGLILLAFGVVSAVSVWR